MTYSSFDGDRQQLPHLSQHETQVPSNTGPHVRLPRLTTRKLSGLQTTPLVPVVTEKGNSAMRRRPLSRIDGMSIDSCLLTKERFPELIQTHISKDSGSFVFPRFLDIIDIGRKIGG